MTNVDNEIQAVKKFLRLCASSKLTFTNELEGNQFAAGEVVYIHHLSATNSKGPFVRIAVEVPGCSGWQRITVPLYAIENPENWIMLNVLKHGTSAQ